MPLRGLNFDVVLLTIFAGAVTIMSMYWYQKKYKKAIPTAWKPIGKVKSIYVYPLKSGRRKELETAECTDYGLRWACKSAPQLRDRCLVVYKENDKELRTARTHPKLLLIETTATDENYFTITAPEMEPLRVEVPKLEKRNSSDEVTMWSNEKMFTLDCGDEAAKWFSQYLTDKSSGLRLGFHDGQHKRNTKKYHKDYIEVFPNMKQTSGSMYTDLSPILLLSQATVDDVAKRVPNTKVTAHNFRPNILIEGDNMEPYSEDKLDWVKIGDVVLRNLKPCTRCSMTTIDPETASRSTANEPLKTLKTYRKQIDLFQIELDGNDPVIGIYMGIFKFGNISAGDVVYVGE